MGRNRKRAFQQLPKYVYVNRGRYIYRPPHRKDIVIGKVDQLSIPDLWANYKELTGKATNTLDFIVDEYLKGTSFAKLKGQVERKRLLEVVIDTNSRGRFGSKQYRDITPGIIRKYLDHKGTVSANREIAALSAAWSYCYERDIVTLLNPCKGVRRLREEHRTRLVTGAEYKTIYDAAPKYVQVAMELAYLCRMRLSEVLDTRFKDMTDEGLDTRRLKGSKDAITVWSERLRAACDYGLEGCLRVPEMPIVNNGKGTPIKASTFKTAWQRLQTKGLCERFTFHDLKAMGVSNFKGDKLEAGGWQDASMINVYDRSKLKVDATE